MDKKEYSNGEVTVVWKAEKCIHSANCVNNLPSVFKPTEKPWIQLETAESQNIIDTVNKCPSGALTFYRNNQSPEMKEKESICKVQIIENGPLMIDGQIELTDKNGKKVLESTKNALCRCGASSNKPFCDGSHNKIDFNG